MVELRRLDKLRNRVATVAADFLAVTAAGESDEPLLLLLLLAGDVVTGSSLLLLLVAVVDVVTATAPAAGDRGELLPEEEQPRVVSASVGIAGRSPFPTASMTANTDCPA